MVVFKAIFIFFFGLFAIGRLANLESTKEKRDFKTEMLYIAEIALSIASIVYLFKI